MQDLVNDSKAERKALSTEMDKRAAAMDRRLREMHEQVSGLNLVLKANAEEMRTRHPAPQQSSAAHPKKVRLDEPAEEEDLFPVLRQPAPSGSKSCLRDGRKLTVIRESADNVPTYTTGASSISGLRQGLSSPWVESPGGPMDWQGAISQLAHLQANVLQAVTGSGSGLSTMGDDKALGDLSLGAVKSAKERETWKKRIKERPTEVSQEWWDHAKEETGTEQGMPFSAKLYGDTVHREDYHKHKCLHMAFLMEAEIHRLLMSGEPDIALAQSCCNLKALSTCLRQGGTWKGAWELTYLPSPHKGESGTTMAERAAVGRHLREEAAVERIIAEAQAAEKK